MAKIIKSYKKKAQKKRDGTDWRDLLWGAYQNIGQGTAKDPRQYCVQRQATAVIQLRVRLRKRERARAVAGQGRAATRIQAHYRANTSRMAYLARRDAQDRGLGSNARVARVACTQKMWHQLGFESRSAASVLGWNEVAWDEGVCPSKHWLDLAPEERKAAVFLGFEQRSWDMLGFEDTVIGDGSKAKSEWKQAVAECEEALSGLENLDEDANQTARISELLDRMKTGGQSSAETVELLHLLRTIKNAQPAGAVQPKSVFSRLHATPTKQKRDHEKPSGAGTPNQSRSATKRPPRSTATKDASCYNGRRSSFASPVDLNASVGDGAGRSAVIRPSSAGLDAPHRTIFNQSIKVRTPSATHTSTLTPWKEMKVQKSDETVAERLKREHIEHRKLLVRPPAT